MHSFFYWSGVSIWALIAIGIVVAGYIIWSIGEDYLSYRKEK